jgi:hypothetical protein
MIVFSDAGTIDKRGFFHLLPETAQSINLTIIQSAVFSLPSTRIITSSGDTDL